MFTIQVPALELIFRATIVYIFIFALLRISGKREIGEMSTMELVSFLLLSDAVQNSMVGNDLSLTGGLIVVSVLIGLSHIINHLSYRFTKIRKIIEGEPTLLIHNGKVLKKNMKRERISTEELLAMVHGQGVYKIEDVDYGIMEASGSFSVIKKEKNL